MPWKLAIAPFLALSILLSCHQAERREGVVLAEVYNRTLYQEDIPLPSTFPTPADSIIFVRSYVEQWARDALFLHFAEQNMPVDFEIDKLVEDYRASLILTRYEKMLVENLVDTTITEEELKVYYEEHKDQYQLETTIVRCFFIKVRKPVPNRDSLQIWWESPEDTSFQRLVAYCNYEADLFMLDENAWYKVDEIEQILPPGTLSGQTIMPNRSLRFTDQEYEYYLRVFERVLNTEIAPLSYIRSQAIRYIMHKRKLELLERIKAERYQRELDGSNIKIYIQ